MERDSEVGRHALVGVAVSRSMFGGMAYAQAMRHFNDRSIRRGIIAPC